MRAAAKRRLRAFLTNPLTIVLPLMALLYFGWGQYISASRDLSRPDNSSNMLPSGAFDTFDANFVPLGWQVGRMGSFTYTTGKADGYVGGSSWMFNIKDYIEGNATLISPKVSVKADTNYLYKGFYKATMPFDLLVRYYYADGTSRLQYADSYPGEGQWTTDSVAFSTGKTITAVSFVYQLAGNGSLSLDSTYLEPKATGLFIPPPPAQTTSLIPNSNLSKQGGRGPVGWTPYAIGDNKPVFAYKHDGGNDYVQVALSSYKNGEAKWQYAPMAVHGNQAFRFSADYRTTKPADIVVEYLLADGTRQFETPATVRPTADWTHRTVRFETPTNAKTMFVSLALHGNGTLDTDNYSLVDETKPGAARFDRPLVSVTFDDGWRSAYQQGAQLLDQDGFRGTFYMNPSVVDTTNFFTNVQVEDLHRRGHEIAAHGYNHLDMTTLNAGQLKFQLEGSRRYVTGKTDKPAVDFASPFGKSDAEVQWYARSQFRSVRGTDSGLNTRQHFDPYNLKVLYVGSKTSIEEVKQAVANAKANNGWLVLIYHRIEAPNSQTEDSNVIVPPETFKQQLKLIKDSGVTVKTVDGALDELLPQVQK